FTELREAHDATAADLVHAHGGRVVRFLGDGLLVAFPSAGQALDYASALQPSIDRIETVDVRLDLRMGIALGDAIDVDGDVGGGAVVEAARLCAAAAPRSVLCTIAVTLAARTHSDGDFGPSSEMSLKGLAPIHVREFLRRSDGAARSGLWVAVLGRVRAERAGRELDLGGLNEQRVLDALAAGAGRAVSTDELVEALWGDDAPRSAERSVHAYVARLRKALEPSRARGARPRVLVTEGRSYRVAVADDTLDSARFERLVTGARD